jgi:hypothetical protein
MLDSICSMIPDPENPLSLEPEEFAGVVLKDLNSPEILLLSLSEQHCSVARITEIGCRLEEIMPLQQAAHVGLDKMIPSVIAKAFRGES